MRQRPLRCGRFALSLAAALAVLGWAGVPRSQDRPKLVVVLTIDQMPGEMLERYGPYFSGGFGRFLGGATFTDAHQDHANTVTAAGHATLATGLFPAHHGIVGNDFYDRAAQRSTYCAADSTALILDYDRAPGRSPRNLLRPALGDWLKAASPESKVFGLAIKDRSAILPAGLQADAAYWYHYSAGRFVTSSYYMEAYPEWVQAFSDTGGVEQYHGRAWDRLLSDEAYVVSREDSFPAEFDGQHTTFPHPLGEHSDSSERAFYNDVLYTPFGDEFTLAFARELVTQEALGLDEVPDILFLGLSTPDFIGHRYGPFSQEVQDLFLRLDRGLEEFFAFLDERVGAGQYVVALSADHGVLALPEELVRRGIDAGRLNSSVAFAGVREAVIGAMQDSLFTAAPRLRYVNGIVVSFDSGAPDAAVLAELRSRIALGLDANEMVVQAFTLDALATVDVRRPDMTGRFRRSFHPDRAADVAMHFKQHHVLASQGTSHGSAWDYDTHVPLALFGPGITPGRHGGAVRTVDLAPTLAVLLGLTPPADLDGHVLRDALTQP